jgi:hypothetical protein
MSKGLKINNQNSTVAVPETKARNEIFEKAAEEAAQRLEGYKKKSWDLGLKFKGIIDSFIIPENKTPLLKDLENETLQELSQLANEINNDEIQQEGMGSVALCQLIMKMMIHQKDQVNILRYRLEELEKKHNIDLK